MRVQFDPRLADELERLGPAELAYENLRRPVPPDALVGYARLLTERGGFEIRYRDQLANTFLDCTRIAVWVTATGAAGWWLLFMSPLPIMWGLPGLLVASILNWLVAFCRIPIWHSIEIHPDGMIVDGRFFSADLIGDNWPQLQMKKNDDPDRLVLCGLYGTRFVEFASVNRFDHRADRIPEILAQDLQMAMEQLWGRRDAIQASPSI
jgi:hypothetical protein